MLDAGGRLEFRVAADEGGVAAAGRDEFFVTAALGAAGVGIYLGRYMRWNSWDLLVQPAAVLRDTAARFDSPQLIGMSLVMAAFLTVAYTMLYVVLDAALDAQND